MFRKRRFCKPGVLALARLHEKKKLEQEEKNNGEQISRNEISQLTTVTYVREVVYESSELNRKGVKLWNVEQLGRRYILVERRVVDLRVIT